MRKQAPPDSQTSNWTFLDRLYQQNSTPENADTWRVGPNKIIHEESSDMSFSSSNHDSNKLPNNPPVFGLKEQVPTPVRSRLLPKVKSSTSTKITPPSSSSRTPPRSARSSIKYSRQFEEIIRGQLQQKPEIEQQEDDLYERMSEISFFGANVNDIRKRAHGYRPVMKKRPNDVDPSLKIQDSNILKLSRDVLKELKKDKQEEKLAFQLKWLKKHNINKMFESIRKESDKKIKETVDKLRIIKKQDIAFHEKVTKELQELDYMSKEIIIGFEKLQHKASLDFKEQQIKKLENTIIQNCPNCREGVDEKAIRRMESNPYAPDVAEDEDLAVYSSKQSRFRRKQLKSLVQQNQTRGKSQDIISSSATFDFHDHTGNSLLSCSKTRKTTETPTIAASTNFLVKVLKSPVLSDRVILKFTSGSSSFEVEVRINETVEIGFQKKQEDSFRASASPASSSTIKEERSKMKRLFQSATPEEIENQTEKGKSGKLIKLQRVPTRDLSSICDDCAAQIEGAKVTLNYFAEEDEKAISIEANYMEGLLKKLSFAPSNLEKSALFVDRVESMNFLKEVGKTSEALFESCFDMVPLHATRIEKLFKSLVLFFEVKIRNYICSQRALLLEVEESKIFMHKKKHAFDQISKLQNENRKLFEDLRFLERFLKETKQKYKKQVKLLMQKVEELRGYKVTRKDSSPSDDDSNSQNSSQRSHLHFKDNLTPGLYELPEQLLKILPDEIN